MPNQTFILGDGQQLNLANWPVLQAALGGDGIPVLRSGILTPSYTFTRPTDATAYSIGDLVANHATTGSVVPLSWQVAPTEGVDTPAAMALADRIVPFAQTRAGKRSAGNIKRVRIKHSDTSVALAQFRLHLFTAAPVLATGGDNLAYTSSGTANYIGFVDVTLTQAWTDGASGFATCDLRWELQSAGQKLYGLVEALAAYDPPATAGMTMTVTLEIDPN